MHNRGWHALAAGIAIWFLFAIGVASAAQGGTVPELIANGGFEDGMTAWQWEQWDNKPLPGEIDKADKIEGAASFKMGLAGATGSRYLAHEVKLDGVAKDYVLSFAIKGSGLADKAAYVRVGIEGRGWLGSAQGKSDIVLAGGTFDWQQVRIPISAATVGDAPKLTLFFYHSHVGQGTFWIDGVSLKAEGGAAKTPEKAAAPTKEGPAKPATPAFTKDPGNLVVNGGFEDAAAANGWIWEQWDNKPLPGVVDKRDHAEGAASFKMGLAGTTGGRYIAQAIVIKDITKPYVLSFYLKPTGIPGKAGHVRLGVEGKGWLGSAIGQEDIAQTGGTSDWKQYRVAIPAGSLGESGKVTLFFYHDQMAQGTLGIDGVVLKAATAGEIESAASAGPAESGPSLSGDTSHPTLSTYALGEKVELTFRASGLEAKPLNLLLDIVDEHDRQIEKKEIPVQPDKSGSWSGKVEAPSAKMGFYRVKAKLSDGTEVKKLGTRHAGFITYAVVPDPAKRVNYGEMESMLAMQGGFGPWADESLAYLGARWVLDSSMEWKKNEPNRAGEFAEALAAGKVPQTPVEKKKWQSFTLPTLMAAPQWAVVPGTCPYMTGVLTPEGEKAWVQYCKQAVQVYAKRYPDRQQRIYQITWEPIQPWGFKGRNEDLVRIYELAYGAIHEADPRAIVAGPCRGINRNDVEATVPLLQLGLGKFMDMYSTHPYYSIDAERDGLPRELRKMKAALDQYTGKDLPMIGTEQGYTTQEELDKEIIQARGLVRQNLITLGEGYRFNFTYYIVDYVLGEQKGYGYYYNLVDGVPWGPAKASPRPVAPAYAASSFFIDGHKPVSAIEWLGETALGYAFQREDHVVLALWDWGSAATEIALPVGSKDVHVYDWMGNELTVPNTNGIIATTIGPEPIYITGVSPKIWGAGAQRMLLLDKEQLQVYPGAKATLSGKVKMPAGQAFKGSVVLDTGGRLGAAPAPKEVSLDAGETLGYSFDLPIGNDVNPGIYPVKVLLKNGVGTVAAAGARLRLTSPVTIAAMDPAQTSKGGHGVSITLVDEQGKGFEGSMDLELVGVPETRQQVAISLPAGGKQRIVAVYDGIALASSKTYQISATVKAQGGYTFTRISPVNFITASRPAGTVALDGNMAKWASLPAIPLAGKSMVIRSPEYFHDDFSAELRYAWDDQYIYVIAKVNDRDFYQPNNGVLTWRGDCLQLAFNLDPRKQDKETSNVLDVNQRRRASEINVALTPSGPEAFRSVSYDSLEKPLALLKPEEAKLAIKHDGSVLTYEVAISWKALGAEQPPKQGDLIGIAAAVNDSDSAQQKDPTGLGLFGGIVPEKNSDKFGLLLLGK